MKTITIKTSVLLSLLGEGGVFAGKNRVIPVLSCVRLTTHNERIKCESADAESHIRVYADCDSSEDMSFCVNHKELSQYVGCITSDMVTLEYDETAKEVIISHANGTLSLGTEDSTLFPQMRAVEGGSVDLDVDTFVNWINTATNFCMTTQLTTGLAGVNIYANADYIGVTGATHSCIFAARMQNKDNTPDFNIVIRREVASVLAKTIRSYETVKLSFSENAILVTAANMGIYINLMEAAYPSVDKALQYMSQNTFKVSNSALRGSVKRILTQIPESNMSALHLCNKNGTLSMKYDQCYATHKKACDETILAEGCDFLDCMVNTNNLNKILQAYPSENVIVHKDAHERAPFMFTYEAANGATETYLLGIMI